MRSNKYTVWGIYVEDPVEKAGRLEDIKLVHGESFCFDIAIHLKYDDPEEYDVDIYSCLLADKRGFYEYLLKTPYEYKPMNFVSKAIIVEEYDISEIITFIKNYFNKFKRYTRAEQTIKIMNKFYHDYDAHDEHSEVYDFLLRNTKK